MGADTIKLPHTCSNLLHDDEADDGRELIQQPTSNLIQYYDYRSGAVSQHAKDLHYYFPPPRHQHRLNEIQ